MKPAKVAADAGVGLAAGLAGTAAMTVSTTVEMKLRGRPGSMAPAQAAGKVLGIHPEGEQEQKRFAALAHWGYGTGWGAVRGLLAAVGLPAPAATATHLAAVWGTEQVMLPALGITPPLTRWGAREIAIDAWHHLVYAVVTSTAFELLARTRSGRRHP